MKRKQQEGTISQMDYLGWVISHEENCYHNHEGSSQVICLLLLFYLETCHLYYFQEIDFLREKHEGVTGVEPKMCSEYAVIEKLGE